MKFRTPLLVAVVAAWSIAPLAWSQEQEDESLPPAAAPDARDPAAPANQGAPVQESVPGDKAAAQIDDRKIEQFADAYVAVQTIQQKAAADLQSATNPEQAAKVKSNAENQMIAAVERTGLKVDEFNQIVETMASNNDVRSRVAAKLQQRTGTPN
jgi:Domain of unknown function (DUF4168)